MPKLLGGSKQWAGYGTAMENFGVSFASEWWGLAAALGETFGGLLLALGLFFRPASLAIMTVMIVATTNHIVSGQGTAAHAFKNAWLFAGFFLMGPGRYSLDQYLTAAARAPARLRRRGRGSLTAVRPFLLTNQSVRQCRLTACRRQLARASRRPASPDTRRRILAAAADEFGARGFAATTVDRIARRARVNKAMIYYHFPNKRALYATIVRDHFTPIAERLARHRRAAGAARGPARPPDRNPRRGDRRLQAVPADLPPRDRRRRRPSRRRGAGARRRHLRHRAQRHRRRGPRQASFSRCIPAWRTSR